MLLLLLFFFSPEGILPSIRFFDMKEVDLSSEKSKIACRHEPEVSENLLFSAQNDLLHVEIDDSLPHARSKTFRKTFANIFIGPCNIRIFLKISYFWHAKT